MKLSMSVPFRSENLVGSVILGKKPSDVIQIKIIAKYSFFVYL